MRNALSAEYDIGSVNGDFILEKGIGDPGDISRSYPNAKKTPEQSILDCVFRITPISLWRNNLVTNTSGEVYGY